MAGQVSTGSEKSTVKMENLGPHLNRVIWVLAGLSGLFLGLRLFCKLWKRRPLWWDDIFLIASWVRPLTMLITSPLPRRLFC